VSRPRRAVSTKRTSPQPIARFRRWAAAARARGQVWSDVIALATADRRGRPSVRAVILQSVDERGFVFFTDRRSRKGCELDVNPAASFTILWSASTRHVRVEGQVELLESAASDAYFRKRPRGSQLAAWASRQSAPIATRLVLDQRMRELQRRFRNRPIPRPPYWGGYRLVPNVIEFWQGRPNRLHDRVRYRRRLRAWREDRLSP